MRPFGFRPISVRVAARSEEELRGTCSPPTTITASRAPRSISCLVTLEDLLEEIVGEIADGYDLPDESITWLDLRTARIHGTFPIDDFAEQFQIELPLKPFHTLAGLVFDRLGRMPRLGHQVRVDGIRLCVLAVKDLRITLLEAST